MDYQLIRRLIVDKLHDRTTYVLAAILALILIRFSLSVVSDQCSASSDTADFSFGSIFSC